MFPFPAQSASCSSAIRVLIECLIYWHRLLYNIISDQLDKVAVKEYQLLHYHITHWPYHTVDHMELTSLIKCSRDPLKAPLTFQNNTLSSRM